jgi:hypothetical protein
MVYLVRGFEKYSSNKGHLVSFHYPTLTLKGFQSDRKITPMSQDVFLHCTCPAFQYWGSAYNSTEREFNLGPNEERAPDVRDPRRENWVCKHVLRAARFMSKKGFPFLYKRFTKGRRASIELFEGDAEVADFGMMSFEEILPVVGDYLGRQGYSDEDKEEMLFSCTAENWEEVFLAYHVIV